MTRSRRREIEGWGVETRRWAFETARDLAIRVRRRDPLGATPYQVGVVLGPQETPWAECPAKLHLDTVRPEQGAWAVDRSARPGLSPQKRSSDDLLMAHGPA